jgi:hypothetical protein
MSAWAAAYAAANAAEFACRTASVVLVGRERRQALARAAVHAATRTRIQASFVGQEPLPVAPPAYSRPDDLITPGDGRALISQTENALVPVYADVAAATSGIDRTWAVEQAIDCAVSGVLWGGASQAFPQASATDDVPTQAEDQ